MADREKVIEALQYLISGKCTDTQFDYLDEIEAAIALLKEQEAVEPKRDANCVRMFRCGVCGEYVGFIDSDPGDPNEQDNYCRSCGRKVNWNDG